MPVIDASGLIPKNIATEITAVAQNQSLALQRGRRVPMPAGISQMPVQASLPSAGWVSKAGGRKPFTDLKFSMLTMTAEEIAAVVAIPQVYLDDVSINLWNFVKPQLASAFAVALDAAVFFGTDAPPTFPAGGITAAAYCQTVPAGADALDTVNLAMSAVQGQGLQVTGSAADVVVEGALRGIRDNNGALLLGAAGVTGEAPTTLYGRPISFSEFPSQAGTTDFITGNWDALTIGVRQDIRYDIDGSGVIADADGKVIISAFQDDTVLMRAYARYGVLVINPPTRKFVGGAKPFAKSAAAPAAAPPPEELSVQANDTGNGGVEVTSTPAGPARKTTNGGS